MSKDNKTLGCSGSCPPWSGLGRLPGPEEPATGRAHWDSRHGAGRSLEELDTARHPRCSPVAPVALPPPAALSGALRPPPGAPRAQPTKRATVRGPYANAPGGQRPAAGFQPERVGRAGGGRAPGIEHHCLCGPRQGDLHRLRELRLWGQTEWARAVPQSPRKALPAAHTSEPPWLGFKPAAIGARGSPCLTHLCPPGFFSHHIDPGHRAKYSRYPPNRANYKVIYPVGSSVTSAARDCSGLPSCQPPL